MSRLPRSYLFVPADRPERLEKALASGADVVVLDLEDAVAPASKAAARDQLSSALRPDRPVVVRVNGVDTPWFQDDIALAAHPGVQAVMLPKSESADSVRLVHENSGGKPVLALVETALGLHNVHEIAFGMGVARLVFGSIDFQFDLDIPVDDEHSLLWFRSQLVLASRVAQLPAPVDGVSTQWDDQVALRGDALRSRSLGFGAKLCIHPKQIAIVNSALTPGSQEIEWARRVLEASAKAQGAAFAVDGKMVDLPVLRRAQRLIEQAYV